MGSLIRSSKLAKLKRGRDSELDPCSVGARGAAASCTIRRPFYLDVNVLRKALICQRLGRIHLPKVKIGGLHREELVLIVTAYHQVFNGWNVHLTVAFKGVPSLLTRC
jgi:hypothetical protein